jgi:ankyrin repeat protein
MIDEAFLYILQNKNQLLIDLLKEGLDPNAFEGDYGITLMMYAAQCGRIDVMRTLIEAGAKLNYATFSGRSALSFAIERENVKMITFLLDNGVDVGMEDLIDAIYSNISHEMLERLVKTYEIDLDILDNDGATILTYAWQQGKIETAKMLLALGASITNLFTVYQHGRMVRGLNYEEDQKKLITFLESCVHLLNEEDLKLYKSKRLKALFK